MQKCEFDIQATTDNIPMYTTIDKKFVSKIKRRDQQTLKMIHMNHFACFSINYTGILQD